jgi:molybdopterin converting factor small subunit
MIKGLKISHLRNSEFIEFFTNLIAIIFKFDPEKLGIKKRFELIEPNLKKVEELHGKLKKSKFTKEKEDLDKERDKCIKGISKIIDGYTDHYDEKIKEAAEILLAKIDTYGSSIADQNYPTETTSLTGITTAFTTEKIYIQALETLHLAEWSQLMKEKNDTFRDRYLASIEEKALVDEEKVKDLRITIGQDYGELKKHINAHLTLTPENYQALVAEINSLLDEFNGLLNRRKGGKDDDQEEAEG